MSDPVGPFTAFGQFGPGMLDLRVFDQDEYWVDATGTGHRLHGMEPGHRRNVVAYCLRNAAAHHAAHARATAHAVLGLLTTGDDTDQFIGIAIAEHMLEHTDPWEWLEATPLMRQLRRLTPDAPTLADLIVDQLP